MKLNHTVRRRGDRPRKKKGVRKGNRSKSTPMIPLSTFKIKRLYNHRNLVEKVIEEVKNDYAIQKLPRKKFTENTCYVLLTLWSYNRLNDYALTGLQKKDLCFQQLKSLRPILFSFTAIVIYPRFAMYLSFEITHPLQDKLLNFNDL